MVLEFKPRLGLTYFLKIVLIHRTCRVDTINILTYMMLRRFLKVLVFSKCCGFFNLNNNGIGI